MTKFKPLTTEGSICFGKNKINVTYTECMVSFLFYPQSPNIWTYLAGISRTERATHQQHQKTNIYRGQYFKRVGVVIKSGMFVWRHLP